MGVSCWIYDGGLAKYAALICVPVLLLEVCLYILSHLDRAVVVVSRFAHN